MTDYNSFHKKYDSNRPTVRSNLIEGFDVAVDSQKFSMSDMDINLQRDEVPMDRKYDFHVVQIHDLPPSYEEATSQEV